MPDYHIIPLISTGTHSLKCLQEMPSKHAPRNGKNNNPRKQRREVTIGEFIAGTAAYQSNDRKSSPNSTEETYRTNMTSITVLRIWKDNKSNTGAHSQVFSFSSVWKFLVKTMLLTISFSIALVFIQGQIRLKVFFLKVTVSYHKP